MILTNPYTNNTGANRYIPAAWRLIKQASYSLPTKPTYLVQLLIKSLVDKALALSLIIIFSPLLLLTALIIFIASPGRVIYKSKRIGRHQQAFNMYKFRTMVPNAHSIHNKLRNKAKLENNLFKIHRDPRLIWGGHFLRKYSLDELPQLFNVLKGDMSLVGPRPLIAEESEWFKAPYTLRFQHKPGMTGLWQVSGRSNIGFKGMCNMDLTYAVKWNLWLDIKILFKTFKVVMFPSGAY